MTLILSDLAWRRCWAIVLLTTFTQTVACTETSLDVSADPAYSKLIGRKYEVIGKVDGYGIKMDPVGTVEYITLIPPPGIGGWEVDFKLPVTVGAQITILQILDTNRWPDNDISFVVRLERAAMPMDRPVRIDLFRGNEGRTATELNPAIYRRL